MARGASTQGAGEQGSRHEQGEQDERGREGAAWTRVAQWRTLLPGMEVEAANDEARLELLHELELLSRTSAALAARFQVGFHASQVAAQIEDGWPRRERAGRCRTTWRWRG